MAHLRLLFVIFLVGLILLPGVASAGGFVGGHRGRAVSSHHAFVHHPHFVHHPFFVHHNRFFFHHRFGTSVVVASPFFPLVVAAPPAIAYATAPVMDVQPAPVVAAPAPMPTLIEYPTGWYQLRGDGVTAPYVWVWIPKPPPPPAEAPPAVPPAPPASAPKAPSAVPPAPRSSIELYRWTDGQGVSHWTDRLDSVPERYRAQAQHRL